MKPTEDSFNRLTRDAGDNGGLVNRGHRARQPVSQLYDRNVQLLFDYGMHVCRSREVVMESLRQLFTQVRDEGLVSSEYPSIHVILFQEFRTLLLQDLNAAASATDTKAINLWPQQQEAVFLKFQSGFSYREVATIMRISIRSVSHLVSQGIDKLHGEKNRRENVLEYI